MRKCCLHFFSAYGFLWFVVMATALICQLHIDTGLIGVFGFPVASLIYALIRCWLKTNVEVENEQLRRDKAHLEELVRLLKKENEQTRS